LMTDSLTHSLTHSFIHSSLIIDHHEKIRAIIIDDPFDKNPVAF
jgi:hypothetical protein